MKIAIVGAGISGSNVLRTIMTHPNFQAEYSVDVFEPREFLGSGLPYDPTDDETIRLNTKPDVMSVDPNNPHDFVEWLDENYDEPTNFEDLVSRPRYGKYLVERFSAYYTHEQVRHVQSNVIDVEVLNAQTKEPATDLDDGEFVYRLKTEDGWQDTVYDAVFFSVGHPEYNDFYNLKGTENYVHNPYPMKDKLTNFNNSQKISVVGSGATGIDLMRFFATHYDLELPLTYYDVKEPFHAVNIPYEKGDVQYSLTAEWVEAEKIKHGGFIPFEVMLDVVREDLKHENVDAKAVYDRYKSGKLEVYREALESKDQELAVIQHYASQSVFHLPFLYNALTGEDQQYYMKNYHKMMNFFKSKVPYKTYEWLFELIDAGKVETVSDLSNITVLEDGRFEILTDYGIETADVLVNATGFTQNIERLTKHSELIKNLFNRRLIVPHVNGNFILIDWPQTRVINQRYGRMDHFYFLGMLIGGTQHENNDAGQTIQQARQTANLFMDSLK